MSLIVRSARAEDAEAAVQVLRRSIAEICVSDHGHDPKRLADWLANKTVDTFRTWLTTPGTFVFVAERDTRIVAVGGCRSDGEITLNYVSPDARFSGVSSTLLKAIEQHLRGLGAKTAVLTATATAQGFYRSRGYVDQAANARRMIKEL